MWDDMIRRRKRKLPIMVCHLSFSAMSRTSLPESSKLANTKHERNIKFQNSKYPTFNMLCRNHRMWIGLAF